jgi:hypothetical protein
MCGFLSNQASHIVLDYSKANGPGSEDALQRLLLSVGGYVFELREWPPRFSLGLWLLVDCCIGIDWMFWKEDISLLWTMPRCGGAYQAYCAIGLHRYYQILYGTRLNTILDDYVYFDPQGGPDRCVNDGYATTCHSLQLFVNEFAEKLRHNPREPQKLRRREMTGPHDQ